MRLPPAVTCLSIFSPSTAQLLPYINHCAINTPASLTPITAWSFLPLSICCAEHILQEPMLAHQITGIVCKSESFPQKRMSQMLNTPSHQAPTKRTVKEKHTASYGKTISGHACTYVLAYNLKRSNTHTRAEKIILLPSAYALES